MDKKSLLSVHIAVLLFGTSGLFVKLIPMSALLITLGRALFSALSLYLFVHFRHYSLRLYRIQDYFWNLFAGLILTIHWFFFIMSIQVSTVAIGTITFATYPLFVVFLEPYVFKEKFQYKNLLSVLMIAIGIAFLIPSFQLTNAMTLGIIYGLISSFHYAILSIINRHLAASYDSVVVTLYEQAVAACVMTIVISIINPPLGQGAFKDFLYLMIYGIIFTALAHSLYIHGLKNVKAQTASIISVLEPVYSIFLAILFLHERLAYQEMIGTVMIFLAVMVGTMQNKAKEDET
ncbi:DMT family transporter [Candidatus Stoquefichus massiliensis]|uniref:DMT family transporter n=1 Tax=Candidatus Stoquefichus massiliensis TaxID=1470350 RepID=UPI0004834F91|nr:DMT family transporter [Candidatus Stoquefichus massiliensis]